jgi:hypothetical protein
MTVYGVIQLQQIIDLFKKYKTVFSYIKDVLLIDALDQHHYSHTDHDSMVSFANLSYLEYLKEKRDAVRHFNQNLCNTHISSSNTSAETKKVQYPCPYFTEHALRRQAQHILTRV